jgi:hypothetical protein
MNAKVIGATALAAVMGFCAATHATLADDIQFSTISPINDSSTLAGLASTIASTAADISSGVSAFTKVAAASAAFDNTLAAVTGAIDAYNGISTISAASSANSVSALAAKLSSVNLSSSEAALTQFSSTVSSDTNRVNAINTALPPANINSQAEIDQNVHIEVATALSKDQSLQSSLQTELSKLTNARAQLDTLYSKVRAAAIAEQNKVNSLLDILQTNTALGSVLVASATTAIITNPETLNAYADKLEDTITKVDSLQAIYSTKIAALVPVILVYQQAASIPLVPVTYTLPAR